MGFVEECDAFLMSVERGKVRMCFKGRLRRRGKEEEVHCSTGEEDREVCSLQSWWCSVANVPSFTSLIMCVVPEEIHARGHVMQK